MARFNKVVKAVILFAFLFIVSSEVVIAGSEPDRSVWEELDIVPMPKEIELTGKKIPLNTSSVIVTGESASPQAKIGADWINNKISQSGGSPLPVVSETEDVSSKTLRIIIGSPSTCSLIKRNADSGLLNFLPGKPDIRGYLIRTRTKEASQEIFLAGVDNIGTLYACVTLAELIQKEGNSLVIREAKVTDWPDFLKVAGYSPLFSARVPYNKSELKALKEKYDKLLRWKVSSLNYIWLDQLVLKWNTFTPEQKAMMKEGIEYGKARGVGTLYEGFHPFAGLVAQHPDVKRRVDLGNRDKYPAWLRCWSWDDMRRDTAAQMARVLGEIGATDVMLHDYDTGDLSAPALWGKRCDICRERWGNDYIGATVNKYRIYYEELKKAAPEVTLHAVVVPYFLGYLTQESAENYITKKYGSSSKTTRKARKQMEKHIEFWQKMSKSLPQEITFCIRESISPNVEKFYELVEPHGAFVFFALLSAQWRSFFSEAPAWTGTFYNSKKDFLFCHMMSRPWSFIEHLAVFEYAWNLKAPGAKSYNRLPPEEQWRHCEKKGEIYTVVLPHLVRNFFGRRAAPEMIEVISLNLCPPAVFKQPYRGRLEMYMKTSQELDQQAKLASRGVELLDKVWDRIRSSDDRLGMDDISYQRFVYIREIVHTTKWMAKIQAEMTRAEESARTGNLSKAEESIKKGMGFVEQGENACKKLIEERLDDPYHGMKLEGKTWDWRRFTPENADFASMRDQLNQVQKSSGN